MAEYLHCPENVPVGIHCLAMIPGKVVFFSREMRSFGENLPKKWMPALTCKEVRSCHSHFYNKEKARQTEHQWLFLDPSEKHGCRANFHLAIWRLENPEGHSLCLPGPEASGAMNRRCPFNYNFHELLRDGCGIVRGHRPGSEGPHFPGHASK